MTYHPKYDHKYSCIQLPCTRLLVVLANCSAHNVQTHCSEGTACSKLTLSVLYRAWRWVRKIMLWIMFPPNLGESEFPFGRHGENRWFISSIPNDILNGLVIHAVCSHPCIFLVWTFFGPAKRLNRCFQASWNIHIRCNLDSLEQSWKLKTEPASSCYFFSILLSILVFFSTVLPERLEHRICCLKMKKLIYTILRLSWNNRKTTVDNYFFASCFNDLSSGLSSHCQLVLIKILILGQYVLY